MKPVVRNINNDLLYFYLGNDEYENIITGIKGVVPEEKARKTFKFNIEITQMVFDNPSVTDLIRCLKMKLDVTDLLNMPI